MNRVHQRGEEIGASPRLSEEWRTISHCPAYEVSSFGRIRRKDTGYIIAQHKTAKGYYVASLSRCPMDNLKVFVARAVCIAFHGPPPFPGAQAAHLDGSQDHNVPDNLAWTTCEENNAHKAVHGATPQGTSYLRAKLKPDDVLELYRAAHAGVKTGVLAKRFGISTIQVTKIKAGRQWGWLTQPEQKGAGGIETSGGKS